MRLKLVGAVCALAMVSGAAQAHVIETTVTGTVESGTDYGLFGSTKNLTGDPFTAVLVINDAIGTRTGLPSYYDKVEGGPFVGAADPTISAYLEIEGTKIFLSGDSYVNDYVSSNDHQMFFSDSDLGLSYDNSYVGVSGSGMFPTSLDTPFSVAQIYPQQFNLFFLNFGSNGFSTKFANGVLDSTHISVRVDPPISAAPEPSIWALMLAGVAAIGTALRFKRRREALSA